MADTELSIKQKLSKIQVELKAPKSQYNSFGKYPYRNVEDIQEGLKPLLDKYNCAVTISDRVIQVGERYYIEATAHLIDDGGEVSATANAREENDKKGMDAAQLTGSTSSYAHKYALGALFAIDDNKDADSEDNRPAAAKAPQKLASSAQNTTPKLEKISETQLKLIYSTMKQKGYTDKNEVTTTLHTLAGVKSLNELTKAQATNLATFLVNSDKDAIEAAKNKANS